MHGYGQTILSSIDKHVFPLQTDNIAYPQSAEAGEQISLFYGFVFHRSTNQCPNLFYGHIRPLTFRQTDFIRIVDFGKRIDFYNFRSYGCIQSSVQDTVVGVKRKVRYPFPFGAILRQQVVDILLAERLVNLIHCHTFSGIIFQYADSNLDLVSIFFSSLCLILFVGFHPVQKKNLFTGFDTRFSVGQLDNALRLDSIGGSHCRFVLSTGIVIRFWNKIHLQIFIRPFAVAVYIQIQAFVSIGQLFHPKTDRFFDFCGLLYSWHNSSLLYSLFLPQR